MGVAHAQPTPDLTREFQAGVDAFRLGHFDEAKQHLDKAAELDPKLPGPHRFLAAVAQAQSRWQDCVDEARHALLLNPVSSETPETRKIHDECRASAGRVPFRGELGESAAISVTTSVPGASIKINGLGFGSTPIAPRPIAAGKLDVVADKPGWKQAHATIDALAGIVTDIAIDLEPDPDAQATELHIDAPAVAHRGWLVVARGAGALAIDGKDVAPASDRVELAPGPHVIELRRPGKDPWRRRVRIVPGQDTPVTPSFVDTDRREHAAHIGLAILGGAGVLAGVGFAAALASEHASAEARDIARVETARDPTQPLSGAIEPVRTRADFEDARSRASKWAIVSDVGYGAALAAAGVAAYFLYRGDRERDDALPPFAVTPVPGGAMVGKVVAW